MMEWKEDIDDKEGKIEDEVEWMREKGIEKEEKKDGRKDEEGMVGVDD